MFLNRRWVQYLHNQIGKPPPLPGDPRSLTVPGILVRLELELASFPLTPALSPRRGRALAGRWKIRMLRWQSPGLCLSFRRHKTTKVGRITKARANVSPSPRGEGWGEGNSAAAVLAASALHSAPEDHPKGHMALSHSSFQASCFAGGR